MILNDIKHIKKYYILTYVNVFWIYGWFFSYFCWLKHTKKSCWQLKRRALKYNAYTPNFQPVNSDLSPFYWFSFFFVKFDNKWYKIKNHIKLRKFANKWYKLLYIAINCYKLLQLMAKLEASCNQIGTKLEQVAATFGRQPEMGYEVWTKMPLQLRLCVIHIAVDNPSPISRTINLRLRVFTWCGSTVWPCGGVAVEAPPPLQALPLPLPYCRWPFREPSWH